MLLRSREQPSTIFSAVYLHISHRITGVAALSRLSIRSIAAAAFGRPRLHHYLCVRVCISLPLAPFSCVCNVCVCVYVYEHMYACMCVCMYAYCTFYLLHIVQHVV